MGTIDNFPRADRIAEVRDEAMLLAIEGKSKWPGMSYEQGVEAALDWVLGERDESPMEG